MHPTTPSPPPRLARRLLLAAAAAISTASVRTGAAASVSAQGGLLACAQAPDGRYVLQRVLGDGRAGPRLALPDRGHGVALAPGGGDAVVMARRPGTFALVFDRDSLTMRAAFETPASTHFCGHAVYSADGRWLYATENDFEAGVGVIGVYDARAGYARVAALPSGGIGPHECVLAPDGRSLWVANGGIRTHPDLPRVKLNIETMRPNLARIDLGTGAVLSRHQLAPELHKLSIRHLVVLRGAGAVVGLQDEGDGNARPHPLLARLAPGGQSLTPLQAPDAAWRLLNQYVGSVAVDGNERTLVATAPRGNVAACWRLEGGQFRYHGQVRAHDVGGACRGAGSQRLWLTGGDGVIHSAQLTGMRVSSHVATRLGLAFDNHAVAA